jgi:hypothetical protein
VSTIPFLSKMSHTLTVLSQDPLARKPPYTAKLSEATGPVWPLKTSMSYPVLKLQMYTSKGSEEPALTISPLLSIAKHVNYVGLLGVKVLKFLYLTRSKALTVPSSDELKTAFPFFGINLRSVI